MPVIENVLVNLIVRLPILTARWRSPRTRDRARNRLALPAVQLVMKRAAGAPGLLIVLAMAAAGCASAVHPQASPAPGASSSPPASPSCDGTGQLSEGAQARQRSVLSAVQFVSASQGWVVGSDRILHTADGGRHWVVQFHTGQTADLATVDFTDSRHGWVTGASEILATADGGAHWRSLPEPCQAIRTVHFVSPLDGFAVAGGTEPDLSQPPFTAEPQARGILLRSTDGGQSWRRLPAPADVQTACLSTAARGWLGARGNIYGTVNGGQSWTLAVRSRSSQGLHGTAEVECAGSRAAWAEVSGPGAGLGHIPQIGYHTSGRTWRPIFAEQYFPHPSVRTRAEAPSAYPGPFSAISPSQAVFLGWCPVCTLTSRPPEQRPAPMDIALHGGTRLVPGRSVAGLTRATGAAFLSVNDGWVLGIRQGRGTVSMIMHTADGGRTWRAQYTLRSG